MRYLSCERRLVPMTTDRRLLSEEEQASMREILRRTPVGHLAMAADGPYVIPINFAYDDPDRSEGWGRILFHTGEGRKSRALAQEPRICLSLLGEASFDPGGAPCDDGFAYRSALVEGEASLLTEKTEREQALRLIVGKYDPEAADRPFDEDVLERTLVYAVSIDTVTYKQRPRRS
jgi:uncharacterized protein